MEMNFRNRHTVGIAFRFRNQRIDGKNIRFYLSGYRQLFNNMFDIVHAIVMVRMLSGMGMVVVVGMTVPMLMVMTVPMLMVMGVHFLCFFFAMNLYRDLRPLDSALCGCFTGDGDSGNAKTVQFIKKFLLVRKKFNQGRSQHIARRAHAAVQI